VLFISEKSLDFLNMDNFFGMTGVSLACIRGQFI
jgi:hypothetical protein